jgi:hypothetical protein
MRKFILRICTFIIFSSLFYVIFTFVWGSFVPSILKPNINYKLGSPGHTYSRLSEVKKVKDVDILFLGSSHTYRGFDTRIFSEYGLKTFNLGSSSQTPTQTKVLLNRYLNELNPKIVILEVYPITFSLDGVESSLDILANDKNDIHSLKMVLKTNNIKTYNTLLYGWTRDLFNLNSAFIEDGDKGHDHYVSGGYVEKDIEYFSPEPFDKKKIIITDFQLKEFSEIVELIKNNNRELILIYAPIPPVNYNSFENSSYFDSLMSQYAPYYNFNEIQSFNDSLHFYDTHHLNQKGVELFNKKVVEILEIRDNAN